LKQINQQEALKKLFLKCIEDPSAIAAGDSKALETGINNFPYCQVLNLFYSRTLSLSNSEDLNKQLSYSAIIIPERKILYTILNEPEKLKETEKLKFIESVLFADQDPEDEGIHEIEKPIDSFEEKIKSGENELEFSSDNPVIQIIEDDTLTSNVESEITLETEEDKQSIKEDIWAAKIVSPTEIEIKSEPELERVTSEAESLETKTESTPENLVVTEQNLRQITEEKEITVEIDYTKSSIAEKENPEKQLADSVESEISEEHINASDPVIENEEKETIDGIGHENPESGTDKIEEHTLLGDIFNTINQSAESIDYLKKDKKSETVSDSEETKQTEINQDLSGIEESFIKDSLNSENTNNQAEQELSTYNDDKMPYSFLWWLQKTRMEHSSTYQPYSDFRLDINQNIKISSVDQLSSQIIENIFHLQSPLEQVENAPRTVPFQVKRKQDSIVEKFIKEEPQIRPPDSQKLDTENKARKSAEDPNDLVSETLAQIYADQMLYEKAISTYRKLSLKVPEKSTYFADRIRELEKKVN
jgi:hypothetical protein